MEIHEKVYINIKFFKEKPLPFIAWIGPMLIPMEFYKDQYVFMEGEQVNYIYFLSSGKAAFVLPRFENTKYIDIDSGDYFGISDLINNEKQKSSTE